MLLHYEISQNIWELNKQNTTDVTLSEKHIFS